MCERVDMLPDDNSIVQRSIRSEIVIEVGPRRVPTLWYVPIGNGPWPVLCFLHGIGEHSDAVDGSATSSLHKLLRHGSPAWHSEAGSEHTAGFVVACPQLEQRRRWGGDGPSLGMLDSDTRVIDELANIAVRDQQGDPKRLFLTGFSTGGEGALQISHTSDNLWSESGPWIQPCNASRSRRPPTGQPGFGSTTVGTSRSPR